MRYLQSIRMFFRFKKAFIVLLMMLVLLPVFAKFCPECGSQITDNSKFCSECGKSTGFSENTPIDMWSELDVINEWEKFSESTNYNTAVAKFPEYKIKIDKIIETDKARFSALTVIESKYLELMILKWASLQNKQKAWGQKIFGSIDVKRDAENYLTMESVGGPLRNRIITFFIKNRESKGILDELKVLREKCNQRIAPVIMQKKITGLAPKIGRREAKVNIIPPQQIFVLNFKTEDSVEILNITSGYQPWLFATVKNRDLEAASFWKNEFMNPFIEF